MKKILFALTTLFIASQLLVSCSSESEILSQFSKRKYLKKYKAKNVIQKDEITKVNNNVLFDIPKEELATIESSELNIIEEQKEQVTFDVEKTKEVKIFAENFQTLQIENDYSKDYSAWNRSSMNLDIPSSLNLENRSTNKNNLKSSGANEIVVAILCIFLPPLAVYLYENSITNNFWFDLIATLLFWLPGIVLAFLICFGGLSF
ncbi:YqaE/Pmp3 family membrane protein [Vicingaceae bacterium]|nr:YqaE/Pmp3 family membrane protein [Vicingaceae bacterium]